MALETVDGQGHPQHEERIVEMRGLRIEEGKSFSSLRDAAGDEKLGEHEWQAGFAGEGGGGIRLRFGNDPALARQCALRLRSLIFAAGRAHAFYSSSSPRECASSMTMS